VVPIAAHNTDIAGPVRLSVVRAVWRLLDDAIQHRLRMVLSLGDGQDESRGRYKR